MAFKEEQATLINLYGIIAKKKEKKRRIIKLDVQMLPKITVTPPPTLIAITCNKIIINSSNN
jgi:hypothetical protein